MYKVCLARTEIITMDALDTKQVKSMLKYLAPIALLTFDTGC